MKDGNQQDVGGTVGQSDADGPDDGAVVSVEEERAALWEQARSLAGEEDILGALHADMTQRGLAGSTQLAELAYVDTTSRLLPSPASLVIKGESAAGKNTQVEYALDYMPASAYVKRTATSPKALYYSQDSYKHRMIVVLEATALDEGEFPHIVRTLLSEGRLYYEFTDFEARTTRIVEKEGPTGLITTTTRQRLEPELETRILSVWVPDTAEQTDAVMDAVAQRFEGDERPDVDPGWVALQRWLELADHSVVVPFARVLARLVPPVAVRLRRDFTAVLTRTSAHALLHQASRARDDRGRIVATPADYAAAHRLIATSLSDVIERTVPAKLRETVEVVEALAEKRGNVILPTIPEVAAALDMHRTSASRRIREAVDAGFLEEVPLDPGSRHRRGTKGFRVGEAMPEDRPLLPAPQQLEKAWERESPVA